MAQRNATSVRRARRFLAAPIVAVLLLTGAIVPAVQAVAIPLAPGDVMAAVGDGSVKQFDPTGTLKNTLVGSPSTYTTGMAFDSAGNLYVSDFSAGNIDKYDSNGNFLGTFVSGLTGNPESLAFDSAGNLYIGRADGPEVLKYDSAGTFLTSFAITAGPRGSDWIDLAADQCTLFYTSEGDLIRRFDVCTNTQLADFATLPSGEAYALRIRPNGDVIVAATSVAYRLNSSGVLQQTYTIPGASLLFGMNLDPDGTTFWTGDLSSGDVNRVNIATGAIVTTFNSAPPVALGGLAVVGELRAAETHLTLHKDVSGGTALATAWTLTATGPETISGASGAATVTNASVKPGTYTLGESAGPTGYTAGSWSCTAGTLTGSSLVLAAGEDATCSITNTFTAVDISTAVSYTGPATVQYSDPLVLSGHLQTSAAVAIAGENLGFVLGTDSKTAGPTDVSGNASTTSYNELQQPGSATSVVVSFAGDTALHLLSSSSSSTFTIAKEDCTLAYTGDALVSAASMTNLSAQFGELDATHGDWTGKSVTFTVTDTALNVQTFTALTDSAGVAATTAALGSDVYAVGVSFAGDNFYLPCGSSSDTLVTVQAAAAKITGGGWISQGTGRTNFGFNVISDVTGLHGQLQVRSHSNKSRFHSTSILTLVSSGNSGTWTGTGRWNGVAGYTFTVSVVDNGTSGKKGDSISIVIKSPTNATVFSTGGAQPLKGGNIVVH